MNKRMELIVSVVIFAIGVILNLPPIMFMGGIGIAYCGISYFWGLGNDDE